MDKLDLLQKRAYSHADKSNSPKLMREWIDSDVEVIRQALTRTPEAAPDGGEDIRQLDNYFNITSDLIGNGCEHGFKPAKDCPNKDCDKAKAHKAWEALTRPPLDLAWLKAEITKAALAGEVFIINLQDIDATLDHLQAIRPDIFGGK